MSAKLHSERKHSKYSASGSERWFNCPGSVALNETVPPRDTQWSIEGSFAHENLEEVLSVARANGFTKIGHVSFPERVPYEMRRHVVNTANFILGLHERNPGSEFLIETRIKLAFIHPEMFGTFDSAIVDYFGTLHVLDFKYGAGHPVSPGTVAKPNLQMLFYGIGLAHEYQWNFEKVRLWIVQPRVKGYDGPQYLELPIAELRKHVDEFKRAVDRVEKYPKKYVEGSWCHWCAAKGKCPLKRESRNERIKGFITPIE